jgi:hypothetical protein
MVRKWLSKTTEKIQLKKKKKHNDQEERKLTDDASRTKTRKR